MFCIKGIKLPLLLLTVVFVCPISAANFFQRNAKGADDRKWFLRRAPDERGLQTMPECPDGYTLYKTFYNVLFTVTSEEEPMCSEDDIEIIGEILQDMFDRLLLESDEESFVANVGLLSSKTSVCDIYEDALRGNRNRRNENGYSSSNNSGNGNQRLLLQQSNDNAAAVAAARELTASVFRVYMFRSVGTCYMCYADNGDYRRELQGGGIAAVKDILNQYFATVLSFMQDFMNIQITKRSAGRGSRERSHLFGRHQCQSRHNGCDAVRGGRRRMRGCVLLRYLHQPPKRMQPNLFLF